VSALAALVDEIADAVAQRISVDDGPAVLDVDAAAAFLQVHPSTVRRELVAGRLPGRKVGGSWRLSRAELLAHLAGTNLRAVS
jgi:excisionase family DNA binding protein